MSLSNYTQRALIDNHGYSSEDAVVAVTTFDHVVEAIEDGDEWFYPHSAGMIADYIAEMRKEKS